MAKTPKDSDMKLESKEKKLSKAPGQFSFKPKKHAVKGLKNKKTGKGMLKSAMGRIAKSYK